jgi:hypothetical protein
LACCDLDHTSVAAKTRMNVHAATPNTDRFLAGTRCFEFPIVCSRIAMEGTQAASWLAKCTSCQQGRKPSAELCHATHGACSRSQSACKTPSMQCYHTRDLSWSCWMVPHMRGNACNAEHRLPVGHWRFARQLYCLYIWRCTWDFTLEAIAASEASDCKVRSIALSHFRLNAYRHRP